MSVQIVLGAIALGLVFAAIFVGCFFGGRR